MVHHDTLHGQQVSMNCKLIEHRAIIILRVSWTLRGPNSHSKPSRVSINLTLHDFDATTLQ